MLASRSVHEREERRREDVDIFSGFFDKLKTGCETSDIYSTYSSRIYLVRVKYWVVNSGPESGRTYSNTVKFNSNPFIRNKKEPENHFLRIGPMESNIQSLDIYRLGINVWGNYIELKQVYKYEIDSISIPLSLFSKSDSLFQLFGNL